MIDLSNLRPGNAGTSRLVVGPEHTAERVGSGRIGVLATPVMITVIEAAALAACEHLLPAGHQSLGTHLNVSHVAATPVGMAVTARVELVAVEGRTLKFAVTVEDERELVGSGTHERVVVSVERLVARVARKAAPPT